MKTKIAGAAAGLALLGLAGGGIAAAAGGHATKHSPARAGSAAASRMDDGKQYLSQAKITEAQAIAAAQSRASGGLNEVDLEHAGGRLVFNVDVGSHDVKVDAASGDVVSVGGDD